MAKSLTNKEYDNVPFSKNGDKITRIKSTNKCSYARLYWSAKPNIYPLKHLIKNMNYEIKNVEVKFQRIYSILDDTFIFLQKYIL